MSAWGQGSRRFLPLKTTVELIARVMVASPARTLSPVRPVCISKGFEEERFSEWLFLWGVLPGSPRGCFPARPDQGPPCP